MSEIQKAVSAEKDELAEVDWNTVTWDTVIQETGEQIIFDTVGDAFVGLFTGKREVEVDGGTFTLLTFMGAGGKRYQTNAGWKLENGFMDADIKRGDIVRVTYVQDVDTGQPSPMKDFRVEVARRP
jgi:hypothetical protein